MSMWTHITACLSVDTHLEEKNVLNLAQEYINGAPRITGSEGDADIFINLQSGHNMWTSADCKHCPYKHTIVRYPEKGGFTCEHPSDFECPEGEYQTCIVISIQGDLRDRVESQTKEEFEAFLKYIDKKYNIRDYAVNILGD